MVTVENQVAPKSYYMYCFALETQEDAPCYLVNDQHRSVDIGFYDGPSGA